MSYMSYMYWALEQIPENLVHKIPETKGKKRFFGDCHGYKPAFKSSFFCSESVTATSLCRKYMISGLRYNFASAVFCFQAHLKCLPIWVACHGKRNCLFLCCARESSHEWGVPCSERSTRSSHSGAICWRWVLSERAGTEGGNWANPYWSRTLLLLGRSSAREAAW